jgi:hypothetical protein
MKNKKKALSLTLVLPLLLLVSACNKVENHSRSASMLIVEEVLGRDIDGNQVNFLQSDVLKVDTTTGSSTVVADLAVVTLRAQTVDPAPILGASAYNDIMLDRYTVSYSRTDGRNSPGVDIPYPFEGSMSSMVSVGTSSSVSIVIVREVAKLEPPLSRLVDVGAEVVLQATAKIDFYGHDLANNQVHATGYLPVFFANYAEPTVTPPTAASLR